MGRPGTTEILIILLILVLLFGAKKLPELARGTGRALRIFKSETKALTDDDEEDQPTAADQRPLNQTQPPATQAVPPPAAQAVPPPAAQAVPPPVAQDAPAPVPTSEQPQRTDTDR